MDFPADASGPISPTLRDRLFSSRTVMTGDGAHPAPERRANMAKGQQRSNKEARKPKKAKVKNNASQPSQKGGVRGLENFKN